MWSISWDRLQLEREPGEGRSEKLKGLTFVITGKVQHFANRDAVKALIISVVNDCTVFANARSHLHIIASVCYLVKYEFLQQITV